MSLLSDGSLNRNDVAIDGTSAAAVGQVVSVTQTTGSKATRFTVLDPADLPATTAVKAEAASRSLSTHMIAFGTSLTAGGQDGTGRSWPTELEQLAGINVYNLGVSGTTTSDAAITAGATDPTFTVTGGSIPASGGVALTLVAPVGGYATTATLNFFWPGTLNGVPGTLSRNVAAGTWAFNRTAAGSAVTATTATFHCTTADAYRDRVAVFGDFTNNIYAIDPTTGAAFTPDRVIEIVTRDIDAMIARLTPTRKRYVVVSGFNSNSQYGSNTNYQTILTVAAALAARYKDHWFDVRSWLVANGLRAVGLTPTAQDTTDMGRDAIPISLYTGSGDDLHLNSSGYAAWAAGMREFLNARDWLPPSRPVQVESVDPILTRGSLMLVEPGHPAAPWLAGVPRDGERVPNLADSRARGVIGLTLPRGATDPVMRRVGTGAGMSRTARGGIVYTRPPSGGICTLTVPDTILQYLISNPTNQKFFSWWGALTYNGAAGDLGITGHLFRLSAVAALGNNYYAGPTGAGHGASAGGSGFVSSSDNLAVGPRIAQVWDTIRGTAADQTAAAAMPQSMIFGYDRVLFVGSPGVDGAQMVFYRFYCEDLTVSGRTPAAVKSIDDGLYAAHVTNSGGRYNGDNLLGSKTLRT